MNNRLLSSKSTFTLPLGRWVATLLVVACGCLAALPAHAAANDDKKAGMRLLKAQLPNGTTIRDLDCESLTRAVSRATTAHKAEAAAILNAALMNGQAGDTLDSENRRECDCVGRIVRASVKAAPAQASDVIDMAMALYPDCSKAFAAILDQSRVEEPVAGISTLGGGGDTTSGAGPGSPGSPTFGGSSPSGGFALPTPAPTVVTSDTNQ